MHPATVLVSAPGALVSVLSVVVVVKTVCAQLFWVLVDAAPMRVRNVLALAALVIAQGCVRQWVQMPTVTPVPLVAVLVQTVLLCQGALLNHQLIHR